MADTLNTEPVILNIIAGQKAFDQSMRTLQSNMYRDVAKLERMLNKQMGGAFTSVGQQAEKGLRSANQAATNLSYQLNDIASSLSTGASPFIVMMQQGSQVAQVFQGLRAEGISMGAALGSAFGQVLNPISLVTFAVIGLTGYLATMWMESEEGAEKSKEKIESLLEVANKLRESRGLEPVSLTTGPAEEFKRLLEAQKRVSEGLTGMNGLLEEAANISSGIGTGLEPIPGDLEGEVELVHAMREAIDDLRAGIQAGNPDLLTFAKNMKAIKPEEGSALDRDYGDLINQFIALGAQVAVDKAEFDSLSDAVNKNEVAIQRLQDARVRLAKFRADEAERLKKEQEEEAKNFLRSMADIAKTGDTIEGLSQLWGDYLTAVKNAAGGNDLFAATMATIKQAGEAIQGTGIGVIDAITGKATGLYESLSKVDDKTKELIRRKELFRAEAYYDENHWRVGFGSDTFVDEMGKTQETLKTTVVSLQQAEADLDNRIRSFQSGIMQKIGPSVWNSFNEAQQAALTSVTYNYGTLPDRVANAIKSGDSGQVSKAIFDLGTDNGGINAKRRAEEAALFGGGEFEAPKKAAESYKEWTEEIKRKTEAQRYENQVNADTTSSEYQKIYAIEKEKAVYEGLQAAKRSGLEIDAKLTAEIDAQADASARLTANQKLLDDATEATKKTQADAAAKAKELADQYNSMATGAISGFINDMRHGVSAGEAFSKMIDTLIGQLIEMAVRAMVIKSGLGTALSGIFPVALGGGRVGGSGMSNSKVSAAAFAGAPSYARGGMVGLSPGAVPVVAHAGEIIVPTSALRRQATQTRRMGGGGGDNISVGPTSIKVDIANGGGTAATQSSSIQFSQVVDRTVQAIIVRESKPGGLLRREGAR